MNASKSLTAAVAAAALVGSIGFAYAQTDASAGGQGPAIDTPAQSATTPSTDSSVPSSSSSDMSNSGTTATLDERADRN